MVMGGPVIDDRRNLFLTILEGLLKFSHTGVLLWSWRHSVTDGSDYLMNTPALMDGRIYTCSAHGRLHAVDMETGLQFWEVSVAAEGIYSDNGFILARDGLVILDVGQKNMDQPVPNVVLCVNGTDGTVLWQYRTAQAVWNFLPLFTMSNGETDGTIVFQDIHGGVYRVNLATGKEVWKNEPQQKVFTDGGAALGSNGVLYAVTSLGNPEPFRSTRGGLHAYNVSDGSLLWKHTDLEMGIYTWPVVANSTGSLSVVTGVGSLPAPPYSFVVHKFWTLMGIIGAVGGLICGCCSTSFRHKKKPGRRCFATVQLEWKSLAVSSFLGAVVCVCIALPALCWYSMPKQYTYSVQAFNAMTGEHQWRVNLPTWHWHTAAGEEEGFYTRLKRTPWRTVMMPCASSYPVVDAQGVIFFTHMDGHLYSIRDRNDDGTIDASELCRFKLGSTGFTAGPSLAPGLLAVATSDSLYVFGD